MVRTLTSALYFLTSDLLPGSIFEQTVESLAGSVGPGGHSSRSLLLHAHADRIEPAFVAGIFLGNSFRDRLRAFESARRIEVGALFAGVEFEAAFGASTEWLRPLSEQRAALGTAGNRVSPWHLHRAWPEGVLPYGLVGRRLLTLSSAVLIPVLAVLTVGHTLSLECTFGAEWERNILSLGRPEHKPSTL